jgi:hypothetical protein
MCSAQFDEFFKCEMYRVNIQWIDATNKDGELRRVRRSIRNTGACSLI